MKFRRLELQMMILLKGVLTWSRALNETELQAMVEFSSRILDAAVTKLIYASYDSLSTGTRDNFQKNTFEFSTLSTFCQE